MRRLTLTITADVDGVPVFTDPIVVDQYVDHCMPIRQTMPASGSGGSAYNVFGSLSAASTRPRTLIMMCPQEQMDFSGIFGSPDTFSVRAGGILLLAGVRATMSDAPLEVDLQGFAAREVFGLLAGSTT